jgi:hypothetical protein
MRGQDALDKFVDLVLAYKPKKKNPTKRKRKKKTR